MAVCERSLAPTVPTEGLACNAADPRIQGGNLRAYRGYSPCCQSESEIWILASSFHSLNWPSPPPPSAYRDEAIEASQLQSGNHHYPVLQTNPCLTQKTLSPAFLAETGTGVQGI